MKNEYTVVDFEIISSLPIELEGLSPQILFALFEIAIKWGEPVESEMLEFPAFGELGDGFVISIELDSPDRRMFLLKKSEFIQGFCLADEGLFIIKTEGPCVMWDKRISLEEAVFTIKETDETARSQGLIDLETDERIFSKLVAIGEKMLKVSEVFFDPNSLLVFPSEYSNEAIFTQFDHPESVSICEAGLSKFVCLKSTAKVIEGTLSILHKTTTTNRMIASIRLILNQEKSKTAAIGENKGQFN